jgi:hypothetical protein
MRGEQNQVERFRTIAKRLVDDHSAECFTKSAISSGNGQTVVDDVYYNHLDELGRELNEQAEQFLTSFKGVKEDVKSEIWNTCKKYIDLFIRRNQTSSY